MKILTTPDPFLRRQAKPVTNIDAKTLKEIEEMFTILKNATNPQGVGLAATQVGLDKRLFILLEDGKTASLPAGRRVFINPKIVKSSRKLISHVYPDEDDRWLEGCLSIPKIWGFVDRPYQVTLDYQTLDLKSVTKEFRDIEAAYVQHETDHLNGILFTDHILKQRGQILQETTTGLKPISL